MNLFLAWTCFKPRIRGPRESETDRGSKLNRPVAITPITESLRGFLTVPSTEYLTVGELERSSSMYALRFGIHDRFQSHPHLRCQLPVL